MLEERGVGLLGELQGVAAVGEHRGAVAQDDGEARAAREAREPREALSAGRHVLAQMLVRARHEKAVEALAVHDRSDSGKPPGVGIR